jgi:Right handed beta helix region
MCSRRKIIVLLAITIAPWLQAMPAQAQTAHTYVSGSGSDSNPCTVALPCLTLQAALGKTLPGGEIDTLTSANYGSVTINQAVTIIGGHGVTGILAPSTVTGITINAGANDIVNLQGLDIDGAGLGANGIQFSSGASLSIQNSAIRGFVNGISFQPSGASTLSVGSTVISNNSIGVNFLSAAVSSGILNDVQVAGNGSGIIVAGAGSTSTANVTVQGSVVANNNTVGILSNGFSSVTVANSTIANNNVGVEAQNTGALLQTSGSTITGNGTGWLTTNNGQVISSADNLIGGNTAGNQAPPTSVASTAPSLSPSPSPPPVSNYLLDNNGNVLSTSTDVALTAS